MPFNLKAIIFLVSTLSLSSCKECGVEKLTANHGIFSSPNYPERYDHEANCTWHIVAPEEHTIHLKFDPFEVKSLYRKCQIDYVKIIYYGGQEDDVFCTEGSKSHLPPDLIKSTTNTLTVNLITDAFFFNGIGFQATYYVVDKFGDKVEAEESEDIFDPDWNDDSTTKKTTTTTTTPPTTTTTPSTTTTRKTTVKTTSPLMNIITSSSTTEEEGLRDGITNDPGAMSGAVIGGIIGIALVIFGILVFCSYIQYKRHQKKRINLNVIAMPDDKELISDNKIYKRLNNGIVRDPEAETFPL